MQKENIKVDMKTIGTYTRMENGKETKGIIVDFIYKSINGTIEIDTDKKLKCEEIKDKIIEVLK